MIEIYERGAPIGASVRLAAVALASLVAAVAVLAPSTAGAASQAGPPAPPEEPSKRPATDYDGSDPYQRYCASCHGIEGDGKGPMAGVMAKPPTDLSRLASRFGTPLAREPLAEVIDGRKMRRSHGTIDMPVWGTRLYGGAGSGSLPRETDPLEMARRGTILRIIDYLQSIQVEP